MKSVTCLHDLRPYGIDVLTGESCAAGYRLLCDLTLDGCDIVAGLLGLNYQPAHLISPFADNWNSGETRDPHVASVMLSPEMFVPLAIWSLAFSGCHWIVTLEKGGVHGFMPGDEEQYKEFLTLGQSPSGMYRIARTFLGAEIRKGRNVHQMTGRVA